MPGVAELAPLKIEAPPEFRRKIKIRAAEEGLTMRKYIMQAVEEKLANEDARRAEDAGHRG